MDLPVVCHFIAEFSFSLCNMFMANRYGKTTDFCDVVQSAMLLFVQAVSVPLLKSSDLSSSGKTTESAQRSAAMLCVVFIV